MKIDVVNIQTYKINDDVIINFINSKYESSIEKFKDYLVEMEDILSHYPITEYIDEIYIDENEFNKKLQELNND